jgi:hypothetical protein
LQHAHQDGLNFLRLFECGCHTRSF